MKTLTLEAPAKINLTLDILGRRTDGYHDMRMVMQAVSLGDTVTVAEAAGGFSLLTEGISLPAGKVTLEQRAADAFFHRLGRPVPGLEVRLAKRVPAYAGLGGGSADVAAVLRCLRTLYAPDLPRQALEEIGLAVGSDVPFCVRGGIRMDSRSRKKRNRVDTSSCRSFRSGRFKEKTESWSHRSRGIRRRSSGVTSAKSRALKGIVVTPPTAK